jgi:hypothetical protein
VGVRLELHHTIYDLYKDFGYHPDIGDLFFGYAPEVLRALCRDCHRAAHTVDGNFWDDPKEICEP